MIICCNSWNWTHKAEVNTWAWKCQIIFQNMQFSCNIAVATEPIKPRSIIIRPENAKLSPATETKSHPDDVNDKLTDKAQIKFLLCSIAHHCDLKDHFRADVQEEELSSLLGLWRGSPFLNPWKHWRQPVIDNHWLTTIEIVLSSQWPIYFRQVAPLRNEWWPKDAW